MYFLHKGLLKCACKKVDYGQPLDKIFLHGPRLAGEERAAVMECFGKIPQSSCYLNINIRLFFVVVVQDKITFITVLKVAMPFK